MGSGSGITAFLDGRDELDPLEALAGDEVDVVEPPTTEVVVVANELDVVVDVAFFDVLEHALTTTRRAKNARNVTAT